MWRGFGGSNLSLQCNDAVSTMTSETTDTTPTKSSTTTTGANHTTTDDVHIYIIAGVAVGVLVAVCALSIVIFKRRKSHSGKADITAKDAQQPNEGKYTGTTHKSSSSQGFFEVDIDGNNDNTRMPRYNDDSCLQQNHNRSNQTGDYEIVDFESDNESSTGLKLKAESLKPTGPPLQTTSSVPASASLSNDDGIFMVYNVAYESADDVLGDNRHKNVRPHDKGVDGLDDDVMMMMDNVAYESSASLQNTDSHQTGQAVQPSQRNAANDNDDIGNHVDDGLIMVENAAYESTASLQHTDSHSQPKTASNDGDDENDDELIMVDNVAYESSASLHHINSQGPGHQRPQQIAANSGDGRKNKKEEEEEDEDFMIDNVAYESADFLGRNSNGCL